MDDDSRSLPAILGLDRPPGNVIRVLTIGDWRIRIEGLDAELAAAAGLRWGGFLSDAAAEQVPIRLRVVLRDAGTRAWIEAPKPGERYRVEAALEDGNPVIRSYHFALAPDSPAVWRVALSRSGRERRDRVLENAVRVLLARVAAEDGGLALHAAGVRRGAGAHLLAGPSNAGKSTAVRLAGPGTPLGDDYGIAVPGPGGWRTAAVPFDNRERAPAAPPRGWLPLRGVWRLYQAGETRLERPHAAARVASILACAAAPWSMPDLGERLLDQARRLADQVPFGHLHFRPEPGIWDHLDPR